MCKDSNAEKIVLALIENLPLSDESMKQDIIIRISLLAEKYAKDYLWYFDAILQLIRLAGNSLDQRIWFRVFIYFYEIDNSYCHSTTVPS